MNAVSIVSQLPDELIEAIFIACVHSVEIYPVVLSQVCKLWRDIAHRSARLWTTIDLTVPERAKHYFELSQGAQLNISWFNRSYGVVTTSTRDWIWTHANRFNELNLVSPTGVLGHIVRQIGDNLSALSSCIMIAEDPSLVAPMTSFNLTMPCLRKLTLIRLNMPISDFFGVLQNSPLLEELEISQPTFTLSQSQFSQLYLHNIDRQAVEQLYLANLRQIEFGSLSTVEQAYIFMHLRLPVNCSLHLSEPSNFHSRGWRESVLATRYLDPLAFSTFKFSSRYIKLVREATKEQYALSWTVINTGSIKEFLNIRALDTSRLYRVEIDDNAYPELRTTLGRLFDSVPATTILVLYRTSTELLPRACRTLPQLREIELVAVNLDDITQGELTTSIADTLRYLLRWRKEQGSDKFCPVQQLVLRHCNYTPRNLEILKDEVNLMIT